MNPQVNSLLLLSAVLFVFLVLWIARSKRQEREIRALTISNMELTSEREKLRVSSDYYKRCYDAEQRRAELRLGEMRALSDRVNVLSEEMGGRRTNPDIARTIRETAHQQPAPVPGVDTLAAATATAVTLAALEVATDSYSSVETSQPSYTFTDTGTACGAD